MILDLAQFVKRERPHWVALEKALDDLAERKMGFREVGDVKRVTALFQRACADLGRLGELSAEPELKAYLEALVSRGYAEIHSSSGRRVRLDARRWFLETFPRAFRRRIMGFVMSVVITTLGMALGGVILFLDPDGREVALRPFAHVAEQTPSERVAKEERSGASGGERGKGTFSAYLMANNISVSMKAMAFGAGWGVGTALVLFYNGVILGAVCLDYVMDGQIQFLLGWLLPHGSFEIPAILISAQAGFVLAGAMIGWGTPDPLRKRLREVVPDIVTLSAGVGLMLVWAGIVEAFFSQYHAPVVPYWVKITFGGVQLAALGSYLIWAGRFGVLGQGGEKKEDNRRGGMHR